MTLSKYGIRTLDMNIYISTEIEMKRLNFNVGGPNKKSKCQKLHIGKASKDCPKLSINGKNMDCVTEVLYLGDIVTNNGKNSKNIFADLTEA